MVNFNKIFSGKIEHVWATNVDAIAFPEENFPEVAFVGLSNVGKSSLINAFCGRNKLARTSNTPGATRAIHFYNVDVGKFTVVDLPGYGFAKMSKVLSAKIGEMVLGYFGNRRTLKCVYVLIDARRGLKVADEEMLKTLAELGVTHKVIFTKMDKIPPRIREKVQVELEQKIKENLPMAKMPCIFTSSSKKWNIMELRNDALSACGLINH